MPRAHEPSNTTAVTISVGNGPGRATWDYGNGFVYVPSFSANSSTTTGGSVTVLNGTNVVATVPVGAGASEATYDQVNGYVYVTNGQSNNVSVISGTTLVGTVAVGDNPWSAVVDNSSGYVYVSNFGSHTVSVLNGTQLQATVHVGFEPSLATYDGLNGYVYVPNLLNDSVSVIDGISLRATIDLNATPWSATFDPANGFVYLPMAGGDFVTVLNGTTILATVNDPSGSTFATVDISNGEVYLTGGTNVTVLNGTVAAGSLYYGMGPYGAAYDLADRAMYVTNWATDSVDAFLGTSPAGSVSVGTSPIAAVYDDRSGAVYVSDNGSSAVSIFAAPQSPAVTFHASGLPFGNVWWVTLNGTLENTSAPSLTFYEPAGTYAFFVGGSGGFGASPSTGNVSVNGFVNVNVSFSRSAIYAVTFNESGLASGTMWTVTLGGVGWTTAAPNITFWVVNGTYSFSIPPVTGYTSSGGSGVVTVNGGGIQIPVYFYAIVPNLSNVTFTETGLPNSTLWGGTLTVNNLTTHFNITGNSGTFQEPNGTYSLAISPLAGFTANYSHSVIVNGSAVTVGIVFSSNSTTAPGTYLVTLGESGLPNGTGWGARLGGSAQSTSRTTMLFNESNGSYVLTVTPPTNYTANYTTPVLVNGSSVSVGIMFSLTTYPVTFLETGLPAGSLWTMTATAHTTHSVTSGQSTGSSLVLRLAAGGYALLATGPTGYRASLSPTTISVVGPGTTSATTSFTLETPTDVTSASLPWFAIAVLAATAFIGSVGAGWGYTKYRSTRMRSKAQGWVTELNEGHFEVGEQPPRQGSE
jgi:YVTN family beta-propeller protein